MKNIGSSSHSTVIEATGQISSSASSLPGKSLNTKHGGLKPMDITPSSPLGNSSEDTKRPSPFALLDTLYKFYVSCMRRVPLTWKVEQQLNAFVLAMDPKFYELANGEAPPNCNLFTWSAAKQTLDKYADRIHVQARLHYIQVADAYLEEMKNSFSSEFK